MATNYSVQHIVEWTTGWSGYAITGNGKIVQKLTTSSATEAAKALREFKRGAL